MLELGDEARVQRLLRLLGVVDSGRVPEVVEVAGGDEAVAAVVARPAGD